MKYTVDRFEGDIAVCEDEDKQFVNIGKKLLPMNIKEGSYFYMDNEGKITEIDNSESKARIKKKMDNIWK